MPAQSGWERGPVIGGFVLPGGRFSNGAGSEEVGIQPPELLPGLAAAWGSWGINNRLSRPRAEKVRPRQVGEERSLGIGQRCQVAHLRFLCCPLVGGPAQKF